MSAYTVLMTKKIAPELVIKAKKQDVELKEIEFIEIVPCDEKDKVKGIAGKTSAIVFTSKNAVNIVAGFLDGKKPDWKIFCIDGATRDQVEECFGGQSISGTARSAQALATVIEEKNTEKEIVFFCGDKRMDELPDKLHDNNVEVEELVVYETKLSPQEVGQHFDGIAFFSPSAVESFFTVNVLDDQTIFFSIGPTTSECLKKFAKNKIIICEKASEESMVETILSVIKKTNG
ncbi:MAG: uroporphyrinogen-III synthase [Chitinophagaceae bacterium]|nr:uroporphyrinogen-III synthase [Chitinophagaceae bacterium]